MKATTFIRKILDEIDKKNSWISKSLGYIMDLMLNNDLDDISEHPLKNLADNQKPLPPEFRLWLIRGLGFSLIDTGERDEKIFKEIMA